MGAPKGTQLGQRSSRGPDRHPALVGRGHRFRILRTENAVRNYLWRAGGGARLVNRDGALHGNYFSRRGVEWGIGGEPQRSAGAWLKNCCAWNAMPGTRATSVR